jgi:tRNA pseudouridine13 synthase
VAEFEQAIIAQDSGLAAGLERAGLEQERRALRLKVSELEATIDADTLRLRFRLGRGAFATAVLHELLADSFEQPLEESEED